MIKLNNHVLENDMADTIDQEREEKGTYSELRTIAIIGEHFLKVMDERYSSFFLFKWR